MDKYGSPILIGKENVEAIARIRQKLGTGASNIANYIFKSVLNELEKNIDNMSAEVKEAFADALKADIPEAKITKEIKIKKR